MAVTSVDGKIGMIYLVPFSESTDDVTIIPVNRDWFDSYSYVTVSPTGDTLLLGTTPNHADLYVVEFNVTTGGVTIGNQVKERLTSQQVYADPDWGPAGQ